MNKWDYKKLENKKKSKRKSKKNKRKEKENNIENNKENKKIFLFKIFLIFLLLLYLLIYYGNYTDLKFKDILPRLSLNGNYISSLNQLFESRILYIPEANITKEYIRYVRPLEESDNEDEKNITEKEVIIPPWFYKKRKDQLHFVNFFNLCYDEKLIDSQTIINKTEPIISVILPHYNREKMLLKSIRSIQNQSFKNLEIIIVNDCSTDNSSKIFDYLLKTDPRIRIFHHIKNLGVFRTRVDGYLYSRGKYLISLEPDDLYDDNYVLEDAYKTLEKYNIDSLKFLVRTITNYNYIRHFRIRNRAYKSKIVYGSSNIEKLHSQIFGDFWTIWNRLVKADIYFKGLYLIEDYVLCFYKNVWDDVWQNAIINKVSKSFAIIKRIGYIYFYDGKGEGTLKTKTEEQRDRLIREFLEFLYLDYNLSPKTDNKTEIINKIKLYYEEKDKIKLSYLKTKFDVLYNLIDMLIVDSYVNETDKIFLKKVENIVKEREKMVNNQRNNY